MSGKKTELTKPQGDDDAAKKNEKFKDQKDTKDAEGKKTKGKDNPGGSEGDDETMGSQGDKKLDPKKQTPTEDEDVEGKGIAEDTLEDDDEVDDDKKLSPLMEEYRRLAFHRD